MAKIQLIRNATLKITFGDATFLIDPMLGAKGSFESYGNIAKNPISKLPISTDEILADVDAVLVSHLHKDHFDDAAKHLIQKDLQIFCQPTNKETIEESGFRNITEIFESQTFNSTTIHRVGGKHGRGPIEKLMGKVSGFVLENKNEPTIYILGDTIFNDEVKATIKKFKPEIIITNSGGAFIPGYEKDLILLDEHETLEIANYAKDATLIAVHLEALDHCTVSRASLYRTVLQSNISKENLKIPLNGEILEFKK